MCVCILVISITLFVQNVLFFSTTLPEKMWSVKVYVVVVVGDFCVSEMKEYLLQTTKKNVFLGHKINLYHLCQPLCMELQASS